MKSGDRRHSGVEILQEIADKNTFGFMSGRLFYQLSAINTPGKTFHNKIAWVKKKINEWRP